MSGIFSGIAHIFQAIFELIQGAVNTVLYAITSVLSLGAELVNSVIALFGGVVGFILGNIVTILFVAGLIYAYNMYQQRQGKSGIKLS